MKMAPRYSIYFITISMALGLGNIWRFPYLIHDYGAGAFLIIYALLSLFIGVPLVVSEILLGKAHRDRDYGSSSRVLKSVFFDRSLKGLYWVPAVLSLLVLSYYCLLSSWILHYVCQAFYCILYKKPFIAEEVFMQISSRPWLQMLLCSVHMLLTFLFMNKGEKFKINRLTALVIPSFVMFVGYIVYNFYTYEDIYETAKRLLYPNFNQLNKASLNFALGQMLFTLSLGFGILLSFGKSLKADASVPQVSARLGLMDSVVSVLMAFVLFPMILSLGYVGAGSEILFSVLPYYFQSQELSLYYTLIFYLLIYLVALFAGLGLMESVAMNLYEGLSLTKVKAITISCNGVFLLGSGIILLNQFSKSVERFGYSNVITFVDDILINFVLPLSTILISVRAYKFLNRKFVEGEFIRNEGPSTWRFFIYWRFIILYGFPLVYIISLLIRFT
ncbi:MAG: sodium-dependent transporter [Bdellovibrionaceae bacterium]|nr:sodium-dependent transporter [Pseudobdellovibrionaceae bacterium]